MGKSVVVTGESMLQLCYVGKKFLSKLKYLQMHEYRYDNSITEFIFNELREKIIAFRLGIITFLSEITSRGK